MKDLVDRQAAIDTLSAMQGIVAENGVRKGISLAWQQIEDLPSAQPEQRWISVKAHLATDEEKESRPDIDYWFDCLMPNDDQEILVTVRHKNYLSVEKDVCYVDDSYGLDSGYDWLTDVVAWMPLPEPYREKGGE